MKKYLLLVLALFAILLLFGVGAMGFTMVRATVLRAGDVHPSDLLQLFMPESDRSKQQERRQAAATSETLLEMKAEFLKPLCESEINYSNAPQFIDVYFLQQYENVSEDRVREVFVSEYSQAFRPTVWIDSMNPLTAEGAAEPVECGPVSGFGAEHAEKWREEFYEEEVPDYLHEILPNVQKRYGYSYHPRPGHMVTVFVYQFDDGSYLFSGTGVSRVGVVDFEE